MEGQHGIFQDSKGNYSSMRVVFVVLMLDAMLMGWYSLIAIGSGEAIAVFSAMSGVAVTLKTIQNQQEKETKESRVDK